MPPKSKNIIDSYPEYKANIGVEIHVQLGTKTKIFCSCENEFGAAANSNICPVCAGFPGSLPLLNRKVVDAAIMLGIATESKISRVSRFSRKHYFYPDLPKNFQITQGEIAICHEGKITIGLQDNKEKSIRLERIHIEEDAGKSLHFEKKKSSIDLCRSGTPLLEIVSYPDISNSSEAKIFLIRLREIVRYLKIGEANMEEGSFRADVNVSVRRKTSKKLGTKVELKNINSFKFISQAIDYEIERQIALVDSGEFIVQETRSWNDKSHKSDSMRSKEESCDYRYFIEPDLPTIVIDDDWIDRIEKNVPELPNKKYHRFIDEYGLTSDEALILISDFQVADFFERTSGVCGLVKQSSNWILRNLLSHLKENKLGIDECKITPETLGELIIEVDKKIVSIKTAQDIFEEMALSGKYPSIIIQEKGLTQICSEKDLKPIIQEILDQNQEHVINYKNGNEKLLKFFVGQIMKKTKGRANPQLINKLLEALLSS